MPHKWKSPFEQLAYVNFQFGTGTGPVVPFSNLFFCEKCSLPEGPLE
jgi:hypothetical protein